MRRKFRVVGSEAPDNIFDDLNALRKAQSSAGSINGTEAPQRRARLKGTFARIPHEQAYELARYRLSSPAWLILIELDRLILEGRGRNPVRLVNRNLKKAGVTNHTKTRALRQLEAAGVISVRAEGVGKALWVTHHWFPLQG
jgi:GTP-sensing pleiotropic transcriptional regulator CodY